jgi:prepilin-type N-terminal cleavage/methylation domain-containing protein
MVSGQVVGGRKGGFTLIELMLAITVLVVALLAAVASHVSSYNLLRTSSETNAAMADLRGAMEDILTLNTSLQNLPAAGSEFANGQPIAKYAGKSFPTENIVATYPGYAGGAAIPDPLQIVLTITWNDYVGRPRTMRIATMKTKQ